LIEPGIRAGIPIAFNAVELVDLAAAVAAGQAPLPSVRDG
jgi:hypothetical protein